MEVRAVLLDGTPARGVRVVLAGREAVPLARKGFYSTHPWERGATTDERGRAILEGVLEGEAWARVEEGGFVSGDPVRIDVAPGRTAVATVHEAQPRCVVVEVVDPDGLPVPGTVLTVDGPDSLYAPVDAAGVQSVDLVTGAGGLVFLPRVPPGEAWMTVTLGDRRARFPLSGERVRVVLPL